MLKHTEKYFLNIIKGKRNGIIPFFLRSILWVLSWPYALVVTFRNWIFDQGCLRRYYPPVPVVISIGNIVVGGTGKTPVTLMLAKEFYPDYPIAILSRGYRSIAEKLAEPTVLCSGNGPVRSPAFCGDEPFLIAQNLPKAFVIVGRNRHKSSNIAAQAGIQLILLDDAMQHRRLARDFDVVVMNSHDLFGQGYFLPRGLLREKLSSLARAHLIVLNHVDSSEPFDKLKQQIEKYTKAPVVGTSMEVIAVKTFVGDLNVSLQGKKVGVFCGIAHPEYFYHTVEQQGANIVHHASVADHQEFGIATLKVFSQKCKSLGAEFIVCTEKDKVKIDSEESLSLPILWVQMGLKIVEGQQFWNDFINAVKELGNNNFDDSAAPKPRG